MTISSALKRIYASAPADTDYVETLQFSHSQFAQDYFFTNSVHEWMFLDENSIERTFTPMPFKVRLPESNNTGTQELQIVLANVGLEMMDALEAANQIPSEQIICVYRVYLNRQHSMPQNDPVLRLTISDIAADIQNVTATATRFDVLSKPFPTRRYQVDTFPGLKR